MAEEPVVKRGSIIRRKRGGSVKVRPTSVASTSGCQRTQSEKCAHSSDVSILVTEASPEGATTTKPVLNRQNSESTVVQVLVHRESEEYSQDEEHERTKLIPGAPGTSDITKIDADDS